MNTNLKRKELSPYGEVQVARVLKLKKVNDPGTPILRERLFRNDTDSPETKAQTKPNYSAEILVELKIRLRLSRNRSQFSRFSSGLAETELLLENSALTEFLAEF